MARRASTRSAAPATSASPTTAPTRRGTARRSRRSPTAEKIDPPALIVRMVKAAGPGIGIIGTSMDEADMKAILAHPQVLICSDGQLSGPPPARLRRVSACARPLRARAEGDRARRGHREDDEPFGRDARSRRSRRRRAGQEGRPRDLRCRRPSPIAARRRSRRRPPVGVRDRDRQRRRSCSTRAR